MAVGRPVARNRTWLVIPLLMFMSAILAWFAVWPYVPSDDVAETPPDGRPALAVGGSLHRMPAALIDGELLLPVAAVHDLMDQSVTWDEPSKSIIVTTGSKVMRMRTGELEAFVNGKPARLSIAPTLLDGQPYVPADPLSRLLGFTVTHDRQANTVAVDPAGAALQTGRVTQPTAIRTAASVKSPVIRRLGPDEEVYIFGEHDRWYVARYGAGTPGYVPKNAVELKGIVTLTPPPDEYYRAWKRTGAPVNLTWEHVISQNPRPSSIGPLPGVNVVAPTWLRVSNELGEVTCRADASYVKWAHDRGYEVWALLDNNFDPELTGAFLRNASARENAIRSVLIYAGTYDLDGINVDFENMNMEDAPLFVQFVRELVPMSHEQGLTVSVDITVKSNSRNWSLCYDRKGLGQAADYLILMAYDEYSAGSRVPGPVASLPWVENGIRTLLEDVPPSKVILGIPFYTRLWRQAPDGGGTTSRALSMDSASALLKKNGLTPSWDESLKLDFTRFDEDGYHYSIWLENAGSLERRVALAKRYGLKGIATWRRGFENADAWSTLVEAMRD
ncbi:MAG: glycosyl hydrolase family 18 protein [Ignavibacteriales bacterium]